MNVVALWARWHTLVAIPSRPAAEDLARTLTSERLDARVRARRETLSGLHPLNSPYVVPHMTRDDAVYAVEVRRSQRDRAERLLAAAGWEPSGGAVHWWASLGLDLVVGIGIALAFVGGYVVLQLLAGGT